MKHHDGFNKMVQDALNGKIHRNTQFALQISKNGVRNLYTLVMNIIKGKIGGMYGKYRTSGYYDGIMNILYENMCKEITQLSDDIGNNLLTVPNGLKLRAFVRYPINNPKILTEDDMSYRK